MLLNRDDQDCLIIKYVFIIFQGQGMNKTINENLVIDCYKNLTAEAEDHKSIYDLTKSEIYSSWQSSVIKELSKFATLTNLVVDAETAEFLGNQNSIIQKYILEIINQKLYAASSKYNFICRSFLIETNVTFGLI